MSTIDIYEDSAGRIYLHRRGDAYVVCRGYPTEVRAEGYPTAGLTMAQDDALSFDDWAGTPDEARENGHEVADHLDDLQTADHIATVSPDGNVIFHDNPGLSGETYLGLDS